MPRNDLERRNYSLFKEAFENKYKTIHPDLLLPEIDIDAEINCRYYSKTNSDIKTV
jgi:hypothetical protein